MGIFSNTSSPSPLPGGGTALESSSGNGGAFDDPHQQRLSNLDSSVNAVSFGFVATAILISMFLVMAIFERFLRPNHPPAAASSTSSRRLRLQGDDLESGPHHPGFQHSGPPGFNPKLSFPSPKMTVYTKGVSVLMPGEEIPTFIAHPAPIPCPPERISWPIHQQSQYWNHHTHLNPNRNSPNRDHTT